MSNFLTIYVFAIIACATPTATNAVTDEDPPAEINSNGTPVIGINPDIPPRLINKCKKKYEAIPNK